MGAEQGDVDEGLRRAFETARAADDLVDIERFLPAAGHPSRTGTLEELVCIDLELGWKRVLREDGRVEDPPAPLEAYLVRFEELRQPDVLRRLVLEEYRVRWHHGDRPPAESYASRFPTLHAHGVDVVEMLSPVDAPEVERARPIRTERHDELPRSRVGRYELLEEVGRGSFARVFRAHDPELDRPVAVKMLRAELADDERMRARVYREARSAARLHHPGIVPVHEVGEDGGVPFIVTELIDGPSLEEVLGDEPWDPPRAAELVANIAEALDYAHRFGIVHRDVKPANVLMMAEDRPLVADFGLALQVEGEASITREGDLLGTPAYMSPEQARGAAQVDARTDVYSLGVMLYRLLCGRLPFEGGWHTVLRRVVEEDPVRPRRVVSRVSADLETICLEAMAKEPERRYASAALLAEDLRRFLRHEPILARPPGTLERVSLWCRRNPRLAVTIAGASLAILAVALVGLRGVLLERDRFRAERDAAQANLYRALVGEARAVARARGTGWWWSAMENVRQAATLDAMAIDRTELRELAVELCGSNEPCFRSMLEWNLAGGTARTVALGPRGELAAAGAEDGSIELRTLPEGELAARLVGHTGAVTGLAFHAEEPLLASTSSDGALRFWDLRGEARAHATFEPGAGALNGLALRTSDALLALACADGRVALVDSWHERPGVRFLSGHSDAVTDVEFSTTGEWLSSCSRDITARVWDVATGEAFEVLDVIDPPTAVAFDREGQLFHASPATYGFVRSDPRNPAAFVRKDLVHDAGVTRLVYRDGRLFSASSDGRVMVWDGQLDEEAIAEGGYKGVRALDVDEEGRLVLVGHEDGAVRLWELTEPPHRAFLTSHHFATFQGEAKLVNFSETFRFAEDLSYERESFWPAPIRCLAVHPSGGGFCFGSGDGTVSVTSSEGSPRQRRQAHSGAISSLAIAADGRRWATGSSEGELTIWDWESAASLAELAPGIGEIRNLSWDPDGRLLAAGSDGIALWDPHGDPSAPLVVIPGHSRAVFAGGRVAVGTAHGEVELFDGRTWERELTLEAHETQVVAMAAFPESEVLITSAVDRTILVWDTRSWTPRLRLTSELIPATWFATGPDVPYLIGGADGIGPTVWNLETGLVCARLLPLATCGRLFGETAVMGTMSGSVVALTIDEVQERIARTFGDTRDPTPDAVFIKSCRTLIGGGHDSRVWGVATSANERWIATSDHNGSVKVWDTTAAIGPAWARTAHEAPAWSVAFAPDGRRLVSTSLDVAVWEVASGVELMRLPGRERLFTSATFLHQRPWLATCSLDGSLEVWDLEQDTLVGELWQEDEQLHQLALDGSGRWLAAASHEGSVLVWDLQALESFPMSPAFTLRSTGSPIWAVGFRADGSQLAAGDEAGTITIWDVASRDEVLRLKSDCTLLRSVSFSSDDRLLAASSVSGPVIVWDLEGLAQTLAEMGLGL